MSAFQATMHEREQHLASMSDQLSLNLDERITDIRTKLNQRLDELSHGRQKEIVGKILALSEQMQGHQKDVAL